MRVVLPAEAAERVHAEAAASYPEECCGLLIGHADEDRVTVTRVVTSGNKSANPARAFEIDPKVWLDTARALESAAEDIVGLYHSHPDHPAEPSPRDLAAAWGEGMVWLIVAVAAGAVAETGCFLYREDPKRFDRAELAATEDP